MLNVHDDVEVDNKNNNNNLQHSTPWASHESYVFFYYYKSAIIQSFSSLIYFVLSESQLSFIISLYNLKRAYRT